MKTLLLLITLLPLTAISQKDFKWDIIIEVPDQTKEQLYSKTRLFIGKTWNSAIDVIQVDDLAEGNILVKGIVTELVRSSWDFRYSVHFMFKNGKARIILDDVYSDLSKYGTSMVIPVLEKYPEKKGLRKTYLREKKYLKLMSMLKVDLQAIVDMYIKHITTEPEKDTGW